MITKTDTRMWKADVWVRRVTLTAMLALAGVLAGVGVVLYGH